jgi:transcriptional regulator with XRE-family HTH domain
MGRKVRRSRRAPVEEILDTPAGRRAYEEELLLGAVRSELLPVLERRGMKHQDLARELNVSVGRVSQILSGLENVTLKSLVGVGLALDLRWEMRARPAVNAENLINGQDDEESFPHPPIREIPARTPRPAHSDYEVRVRVPA